MVLNSLLSEQTFELVGIAGFVFYMLAYALLQLGRISGRCYTYTLLNMLGALLVLVSLFNQFNLASALIQISWIVISIVGLIRIWSTSDNRHNSKHSRVLKNTAHTGPTYLPSQHIDL